MGAVASANAGGANAGGANAGGSNNNAYPLSQTVLNMIAWIFFVAGAATPYASKTTSSYTVEYTFFQSCYTSKGTFSGGTKKCTAFERSDFSCSAQWSLHQACQALSILGCLALGIGWILGWVRFCMSGSQRATVRSIQENLLRGGAADGILCFAMALPLTLAPFCRRKSLEYYGYSVGPSGPLFLVGAVFAIVASCLRMCSCCPDDEVDDNDNDNNQQHGSGHSPTALTFAQRDQQAALEKQRQEEQQRQALAQMAAQLGMTVVDPQQQQQQQQQAPPPPGYGGGAPPMPGYGSGYGSGYGGGYDPNMAQGVPPPPGAPASNAAFFAQPPPGFGAPPPGFGAPPPQ